MSNLVIGSLIGKLIATLNGLGNWLVRLTTMTPVVRTGLGAIR